MLDIGQKMPEFRGDGSTIKGVVEGLKHNKLRILRGVTDGILCISNANEIERMEVPSYKKWRVIGLGMFWIAASTANEDPVVEFGYSGAHNAFGKMTSVITGGEKFNVNDHQKYDPSNTLPEEVIVETSATLTTTWTEGAAFNVWQTSIKDLRVVEAAVAGMTSGHLMPYIVIEIDTGGKW